MSDIAGPPDSDSVMAAIGWALGSWTQVESGMEVLFCHAAGLDEPLRASAIFNAIISFETRLAVCDSVMRFVSDPVEAEMWSRLSARLRKFYKKRHEIAHFYPLHGEQGLRIAPFFTWEKEHDKKVHFLTQEQIDERGRKFNALAIAVGWFTNRAMERRGIVPGSHAQLYEASLLIPHIRELAIRSLSAREAPPQSSEA